MAIQSRRRFARQSLSPAEQAALQRVLDRPAARRTPAEADAAFARFQANRKPLFGETRVSTPAPPQAPRAASPDLARASNS